MRARTTVTRVGGVTLAVLAVIGAWSVAWMGQSTAWGMAAVVRLGTVVETVAPHRALWVHLLRGGFGRVVVPFLLLVTAGALLALVRARRWREAVAAATITVGAIGTVQAVKRGLVPFLPTPPVLSGHMPVVVAAAVAVALAVPPAWRRRAVVLGVLAVVVTGAGVVVAAWHTLFQVVVAALLAAAWPCAVLPFVAAPVARHRPDGCPARVDTATSASTPPRKLTWHPGPPRFRGLRHAPTRKDP